VLALAFLVGVSAPPAGYGEDTSTWRLFGGGVHYRWQTEGRHGHYAACREAACDDLDWRRGNLDNAVGLRLGVERLWERSPRLWFSAGAEGALLTSEYNLSQRDVLIGGAFATGGVVVGSGRVGAAAQVGVGGFGTDDGRGGLAGFLEVGVEAGVSPATRLRLAARRSWLGPLTAEEASLTLRASPAAQWGRWQVGMGVGGSRPGLGGWRDAGLGGGALWQVEVGRRLGGAEGCAGLSLGAVGRESRLESTYGTVPGNQRGREVWELGGWWNRSLLSGGVWELRGGAAVRLADWRDDGPLLLRPSGEVRRAGVEGGVGATLEAGRRFGEGLRLTVVLEPVVWPAIDLTEVRARLGLKVGGAPPSVRHGRRADRCQALVCHWGRDLGALAARPAHLDRRDWRVLGLSALAVGAVAAVDEPIRDAVQRRSSAASRDAAETFRPVSFWGPLAGAATAWAGARLAGHQRTEQAAADALEAVLLTVLVVVPAVKEVSGRARPAAGLGAAHLRPFSEHKSFPSGEVAQAFALATVARRHGAAPWVQGVLWAFAGAATWSRLELDRHWASDAVAGALVGVAMGHWVAGRASARRGETGVVVVPMIGGAALAMRGRW